MRLVIQIVVLCSLVIIHTHWHLLVERLLIHLLLHFLAALQVVRRHGLCPAQFQLPALSSIICNSCVPFVCDLSLLLVILTFDSELVCDAVVNHTRRHLLVLRIVLELSGAVMDIKHLLIGARHVVFIVIIGIVVVALSQFKWVGVLRVLLLLQLQLLRRMHFYWLLLVCRACGRAGTAVVAAEILLLTRMECGSLRWLGRQGGLR